MAAAGLEALFLRSLLDEMGLINCVPTVIKEDNQLELHHDLQESCNPEANEAHRCETTLFRERVEDELVDPTEIMEADFLTKPLSEA